MDIEHKQAEHIDYFVKKASYIKCAKFSVVFVEATLHPSLFAFSEILSVPNVLEILFPLGKLSVMIYGCLASIIFSQYIIYDTDNLIK